MAEGVDYSFDRPNITQLWAAGKLFAGRYFGLGSDSKLAHVAELNALHAMGISTFALAEGTTTAALGGYGTGTLHAIRARDDMAAKNVPTNRPAYFAVDFDVQYSQWPTVRDYFAGINSILPLNLIGIYGGIRALQWAAMDDVARWFFQTYAWSKGQVYTAGHVYQYSNGHRIGGGKVDFCRSLRDDFGQWGGELTPIFEPVPVPPPVVTGQTWDYAMDISAMAGDVGTLAGNVDSYARDLDGLRSL